MSYLQELRRRNVFRVAAGYVVASWLVLQVIDVVGPIVALPDWVPRTTLLVLAAGFPLALALSWMFELTPAGIKRDEDVQPSDAPSDGVRRRFDQVVIAILAVAVLLFALDKFVWSGATGGVGNAARAIAVMPFRSIAATGNHEYFAEGLAEELINLLSRTPGLKVIGRTSSFAFRDQAVDAQTIGRKLKVDSILEGSVRISGNRMRISARLIDTEDASQIWSNEYDRILADVFAVQDDVAAAILGALQVHVGQPPSRGVPTTNQEAYGLFLKARFELNSFLFKEAEQTLRAVIELDPSFAEAYELQAYVYWFLSGTTFDAAEGQRLAGEAASRALALNPDLPAARVFDVAANTRPYSVYAEVQALERALAVQKDHPWLMDILLFRLVMTGYLDQAVEVAEQFVAADPLSAVAHNRLSEAYYAAGRVKEAFAAAHVVNDLDVNSDTAYWNLAHMSLAENQYEAAIDYAERFLAQFKLDDVSWVRELITGAQDPAAGADLLDARIPEIVAALPPEHAFEIGVMLRSWSLYFGGLDRFFDYIESYDTSGEYWTSAEVPFWQGTLFRKLGFTAHPRYLPLARSLGVTAMWDQRGPPDFCRRVDGGWQCD